MTNRTFTAGPWEIEDDFHTPCVTAGEVDGTDWIICDLGLPCDLVGLNPENLAQHILDERSANARLIAAAPLLLNAVADAADYLVSVYAQIGSPDSPEGWSDPDAYGTYQVLVAAAAKATA